MPLRRCAFKLPKNDKYQCPKPGDKLQPHLALCYCRFHDRHAQDRCQVLIEWAGKGAQCDQLAVKREGARRVCGAHRDEMGRRRGEEGGGAGVEAVGVEELDFLKSESAGEQMSFGPGSTQVNAQSTRPSNNTTTHTAPEPSPPTLNTAPHPPPPSPPNHPPTTPTHPEHSTPPHSPPPHHALHPSPGSAPTTPRPSPSSSPNPASTHTPLPTAYQRVIAALDQHGPLRSAGGKRARVDSLDPGELGGEKDKPEPNQLQIQIQDKDNDAQLHPKPVHHPHLHLQPQPNPTHTHTTALYAQCCICLESHSAVYMRSVGACGHVYRPACVRRVLGKCADGGGGRREAGGGARRFLCAGCAAWMRGLEMGEVGRG